jgi:hypothetical protein
MGATWPIGVSQRHATGRPSNPAQPRRRLWAWRCRPQQPRWQPRAQPRACQRHWSRRCRQASLSLCFFLSVEEGVERGWRRAAATAGEGVGFEKTKGTHKRTDCYSHCLMQENAVGVLIASDRYTNPHSPTAPPSTHTRTPPMTPPFRVDVRPSIDAAGEHQPRHGREKLLLLKNHAQLLVSSSTRF